LRHSMTRLFGALSESPAGEHLHPHLSRILTLRMARPCANPARVVRFQLSQDYRAHHFSQTAHTPMHRHGARARDPHFRRRFSVFVTPRLCSTMGSPVRFHCPPLAKRTSSGFRLRYTSRMRMRKSERHWLPEFSVRRLSFGHVKRNRILGASGQIFITRMKG
jgi:hypothetical protein